MSVAVAQGNKDIFKGVEEAFGVGDWDKYPIFVGAEEKKTLSIPSDGRVVLLGSGRSPCEIVGIGPNDIERASPELLKLDRVYRKAVVDYARAGALAAGKDSGVIEQWNRDLTWQKTIKEYISDITLWLMGKIATKEIGSWHIINEGSSHRRAWLHSVNTLEMKRMEEAKEQIHARCEILIPKIEEMHRGEEIDMKPVEELEQLAEVYAVFFPSQHLQIRQVSVPELVRQINSEIRGA